MNKVDIYLFFNQKGGVAKTSLATEVAGNFAIKGKKTLLIDYDAQGNVAQTFGINPEVKKGSDSFKATFDFLNNNNIDTFKECVDLNVKGESKLDVLYGSGDLSQAEIEFYKFIMENGPKAFSKIGDFFRQIAKEFNYEKIVIDTSPSLNLFQGALMHGVNSIIIPSVMEKFSQGGIMSVIKTMKTLGPLLGLGEDSLVDKIKFIVPTKIKNVIDHKTVHGQLYENLPKILGVNVLSWEEGIPEVTAFARTIREKDTTPVLINSKNKASEAITKIVERYLL